MFSTRMKEELISHLKGFLSVLCELSSENTLLKELLFPLIQTYPV
jgi:hypothetical protein